MMENMIGELTQMTSSSWDSKEDVTRGLHEFVQDRPIPTSYCKFEKRQMCESLEVKKQKMLVKKEEKEKMNGN